MSRPRVAVIGAGWAGLAAAIELEPFAEVTLLEAGRRPGGRARRADVAGHAFDNGQHILIGAYRETLRLMRTVGADPDVLLARQPLGWPLVDALHFRCPALPAPWHLVVGLAGAGGVSWCDKLALGRALSSLAVKGWQVASDVSVAQWLVAQRQSAALVDGFWRPLVLSALNTPLATASLATLSRVLADSVGAARVDGELLLPRVDLSALFPDPAWRYLEARGVRCQSGRRVRTVRWQDAVQVDHESFDSVVIATAPWHAARWLPQLSLQQFAALPISTVYLRLEEGLDRAMCGLAHGRAHWMFDRGLLGVEPGWVAAVLSADAAPEADAQLVAALAQDLARVCGRAVRVLDAYVIREKRATFAASVGLRRPPTRLQVKCAYLAGDWVHPEYPATLEGAVQSGVAAARAVVHDWTR